MASIRENHFTGLDVVSQDERRRELNSVCPLKKRVVEFLYENRLVPGIDVFAESIPQSVGNGADDFAVPCDIGQDDAGDGSLTANRHIVQVAALACRRQWSARNPRRQTG
jgi:hypothetical protein